MNYRTVIRSLFFCFIVTNIATAYSNCNDHFKKLEIKLDEQFFDRNYIKKINKEEFIEYIRTKSNLEQKQILNNLRMRSEYSLPLGQDFNNLANRLIKEGINKNLVDEVLLNQPNKFMSFNFNTETKSYEAFLLIDKKYYDELNLKINLLPLESNLKEDLKRSIFELDLNDSEQFKLISFISEQFIKTHNVNEYLSFFNFMKTTKRTQYKTLIENLKNIQNKDIKINEILSFQKNQRKFNQFEQEEYLILSKNSSKNKQMNKSELLEKAKHKRNIYESVYYSCANKKSTKHLENAQKKLAIIKQLLSNTSTVLGYTAANWNQEKNLDWFSRLGYEVGMTTATGHISNKVNRTRYDNLFKQSLASYTTYGIIDILDTNLYNHVFNNETKIVEEFDKIKKSPDWKDKILELEEKLEKSQIEEHFYQKIESSFTDQKFDLNKLTLDDLNSEEVQEEILKLIALNLYEETQDGAIIHTGSSPLDYYTYNRLFGLVAAPKSILMSQYLTKILCMGELKPALAYFQVISLYAIDSIITDQLYFHGRKELLTPQK